MAHLSEFARRHKWKIYVTKIVWVFRHMISKHQTVAVLGKDAYLRLFHTIKATAAQAAEETVVHILKGEIVGKMIPPPSKKPSGQPEPNVSPDVCQHEDHFMKKRGNGKQQNGKGVWWTCINCQTRWERRSLGEIPEGPPTDKEVLIFGKCVGQTFLTASIENPKYCEWVVGTVDNPFSDEYPSPQMQRFAQYLMTPERTLAGNMEQDTEEVDSQASTGGVWDSNLL